MRKIRANRKTFSSLRAVTKVYLKLTTQTGYSFVLTGVRRKCLLLSRGFEACENGFCSLLRRSPGAFESVLFSISVLSFMLTKNIQKTSKKHDQFFYDTLLTFQNKVLVHQQRDRTSLSCRSTLDEYK